MNSQIEGYPQIANLMSNHEEFAILRNFGNLGMLNLLHMQSELMHLEEKYCKISDDDENNSTIPYRSRDWWSLTREDCEGRSEQWDILLEIREKLKDYHEQIARQSSAMSRPKPNHYDLSFFREWLEDSRTGNFPLRGIDRHAWNDIYESDLIALHPRETPDHFSRWFINTIVPYFHQVVGWRIKRPLVPNHEKMWSYSDDIILLILDIIGTILASLLPIASIVALYFVASMQARLGILTGFTALFAVCLKLVTGSRKIEIFAATSA
ncbi:hypothetical protein LSUE1_G008007 [Lachnellula suecica]|uniref:DUF6594 domain-containing protein n=1 Tax=Lachnellula suecica TaxID=602035 RepID=A0A8T9BYN8_9HELO|nr:hypothetical protein LSUE1_G008007 [Lachnellula suecica]